MIRHGRHSAVPLNAILELYAFRVTVLVSGRSHLPGINKQGKKTVSVHVILYYAVIEMVTSL